jgi:hypothetical protein
MNEEFVTLGKRAIASRNWRWMPGMLAIPSDGMVSVLMRLTDKREWPHDIGLRVPDLTDPATLGCLIALVREAWSNKVVISIGNGWFQIETDVRDWDNDNTSSLLMALVSALEAAP